MDQARPLESGCAVALETSGVHGGLALGRDGRIIGTGRFSGPRRHATDFLPALQALCRTHSVGPADVGLVLVSIGPGSFTGLRIGITAARMLALANRATVVGVPTLEVIAQNAADAPDPPERVVVILDAKRQRVYAATFQRRDARYLPQCGPVEVEPAAFLADLDPCCAVTGDGVSCHQEAVATSGLPVLPQALFAPRAETVYSLGLARVQQGVVGDRRMLVPLYVRRPEAEERWERRHGGHSKP